MTCFARPKGKIGAGRGGGLLVVAATWFLLVAPQRSKATDLSAQLTASQAELTQRRIDLAQPVRERHGQAERSLSADEGTAERDRHVGDPSRRRPARRSQRPRVHARSRRRRKVLGTGYVQQPLAVVVQGRFGNVSRFLGDLRTLVSVRGGRLDARGRLYSVSTGRHERTRRREEVPGRQGDGDAERLRLQRPGAARTDHRPVHDYATRPRVGRSRQERPPDGQEARRCRRRKGEEAEDHPRSSAACCCSRLPRSRAQADEEAAVGAVRRPRRRARATAAAATATPSGAVVGDGLGQRSARSRQGSSPAWRSPRRPRRSGGAEPARVVHALRGEGSVRAAGRRRDHRRRPPTDASRRAGVRRGPPMPRPRRPAARRRPGTSEARRAAAGRLRDDQPRRQAAAGAR